MIVSPGKHHQKPRLTDESDENNKDQTEHQRQRVLSVPVVVEQVSRLTPVCGFSRLSWGGVRNRRTAHLYCGRPLGTNLAGKVSGTTRTCVVNLKGAAPPLGKVSSTKNAVQPFAGSATLPT